MSSDKTDDEAKIAGAIGSSATVTGIGVTVAGTSAATMTSLLAVVGGGSMAVGIGVVAAAPLAIGGAVYGLYKWLKD